jgi:multidrug efflux pump
MSLSLVAVFIPILMMGGIVGRLFREFAITLSIAIAISMVVSLTTTPMMCAYLLRGVAPENRNPIGAAMDRGFQNVLKFYQRTLAWALDHGSVMLAVLAVTIVLNLVLFNAIPKGFFPEQDTGRLSATVQADQSISFQRLAEKLSQMMAIIEADPDVESTVGSTGGSNGVNGAKAYIGLNPLGKRKLPVTAVMARFRKKFAVISGASVFLSNGQDIRVGGRSSAAMYQYTLQADNYHDLQVWMPRLMNALKTEPQLADVNTDQQDNGLDLNVAVDRDMASRFGLTSTQIDNALYDAFGQRQVSTIYKQLNQYHVVMVVAPRFWEEPTTLQHLYISTSGGAANGTATTNAAAGSVTALGGAAVAKAAAASSANDSAANSRLNSIASTGNSTASAGQAVSTVQENMIPLATFAHLETDTAPLVVNHQGQFAAATVSFNLVSGASLGDAVEAVHRQTAQIHMPASIHGSFAGTAQTYQSSIANEPILIAASILVIYIVLGILYESYLHPLTIISTIPSAGLGAVLALMLFKTEFSLIALIGVILLIGLVMKNAIMMVDFAIEAEREDGLSIRDSIVRSTVLRFRPILMTTCAAILGAMPLAAGFGDGAELRRPLGISIVGGLIVSQILTLYSTPVIYVYINRFRIRREERRARAQQEHGNTAVPASI